jgi:hypothetical protein
MYFGADISTSQNSGKPAMISGLIGTGGKQEMRYPTFEQIEKISVLDRILTWEDDGLDAHVGIKIIDNDEGLPDQTGINGSVLLMASRDELLKVTSIKLSGTITTGADPMLVIAFCDASDDYRYYAQPIGTEPDGEDLTETLFSALFYMREVNDFAIKLFYESPASGIDGYASISSGVLYIENGRKLGLYGKNYKLIGTVPL